LSSDKVIPEIRRGRKSNAESDGPQRREFWMAAPPRKRGLSPKARNALKLLAVDHRGLTETLLLTYGFTRGMLGGLVRAGLATAQRQTVKAGGKTIEVVRIRITEAGQDALAAALAEGGESLPLSRETN
jgi:hypothetical protein